MKKWRWIIVLSLSAIATMVAAAFLPQMTGVPAWIVILLITGIFMSGYSCSRLDQETGRVTIQIGVKHWKPYIRYIKEGDTKVQKNSEQ